MEGRALTLPLGTEALMAGKRIVLVAILTVVAASAALAQRGGRGGGGGGGFFTPDFVANLRYDGRFTFVRMSYPWTGFRQPAWSHDYPDGEDHFLSILTSVSNTPAHTEQSNILSFGDPEMFRYPLIYLCEPGYWQLTDQEAVALRDYLLKGGFMIVDDFPSWAWPNFDLQMSRVFPQGQWRDLDVTHPVWHSFFEVDPATMPPYYNLGGPPIFRGLFEDNDPTKRMYVIANYQNDLSEYWEFSESGTRPVADSNEAYKFGVNEFIYGITH
jgi:hypothetical protein